MRILLAHFSPARAQFGNEWIERWIARLRTAGIAVDGFNTWTPQLREGNDRLRWPQLDAMWQRGDPALLALYDRLAICAKQYDVLVNYGSANLHPEYLRVLPTFNVLGFFDDPESSEPFSRPVSTAHDLCLVGNVAEVGAYHRWGVKHAEWWPLGFRAEDFDPSLTATDILRMRRAVDVTLLCERRTEWRRARVDRFAAAFPQGVYRGPGWPGGFLPEDERVPLLGQTRIGINLHNSTGPINFRTFYLPANGALQLCDNRSHLGSVFELGREVVGFESIEDAIELCHYYLAHEGERRAIAAAGWRRAIAEYNEVSVFRRLMAAVERVGHGSSRPQRDVSVELSAWSRAKKWSRWRHAPLSWAEVPYRLVPRVARGVARRWRLWLDNFRLARQLRRRDR